MDIFLDSPQDFENLCVLSRTLEVLGVQRCYVHDPHRLIRPRHGKSRTRQIKTISAGAFCPDDTIVFGSEGRGIRPEVLALCDERVTIPQRGVTDSLNLAVSIGIVLFEFFRQATSETAT